MKKLLTTLTVLILAIFTWNLIIGSTIMFRPFFKKTEGVPSFEENRILVQTTEGATQFKTDRNGFNNDEELYKTKKEAKTIIILGDSYTEALQVKREKNFSHQTMKYLEEQNDPSKIFNLGLSGLSMADYILFCENYKKKYNPDILIIQVTESDFFLDAISKSKIVYIEESKQEYSINLNQNYESRLQQVLTKIYEPLNDTQRIAMLLPFLQYMKQKAEQLYQKQTTKVNPINEQKQYDRKLLEWELKTLKEKYNIPIVLVYIPTTPIIENGKAITRDDEFSPILKSYAKKYDIEVIDMKEPFEQTYQQTKQMPRGFDNTSPGNGHLNALGHKLVAQELSKKLLVILQKEGDHAL